MPMIPLLIGAGLGVAQGVEQFAQEKSRQPTAATTAEFSPFTGASINQAQASLHPAQFVSDIAGGAAAGARYAQGGYGAGGNNVNVNGGGPASSSPYGNPIEVQAQDMSQWKPDTTPNPPAPAAGQSGMPPAPTGALPAFNSPWQNQSPFWKFNPYGSS